MGTLFVIATPIGNLSDISSRALDTLREVELILAEDTRVTRKLLSRYEIKTPVTSYNEYTSPGKLQKLAEEIRGGKDAALVTDAGTPGLSDPGSKFVSELVKTTDTKIIPIPGPSAVTALLSVSGLSGGSFVFHGFPPHKKGRAKFWQLITDEKRTSIFYESPHRVEKAMVELSAVCGPERRIVIGRELTKVFGSVRYGRVGEAVELLSSEPIKGEYVIAVEGK